MTIVGVVACDTDVIAIADSRLTAVAAGRLGHAQDDCQKLYLPNAWSILGWAGDLCLATDVVGEFGRRLAQDREHASWVWNDVELRNMVKDSVSRHAGRGADHLPCQNELIQVMIAWLDESRTIRVGGATGSTLYLPNRRVRTHVVTIQHPPTSVQVRRLQRGVATIGAPEIAPSALEDHDYCNFMEPREQAHDFRCFFFAEMIRGAVAGRRLRTISPVFQMAKLTREGTAAIPHIFWMEIDPPYGTYVVMRMEGGHWIQEHRPSGRKVVLVSPPEIDLTLAENPDLSKYFDPPLQLTRDSPGVGVGSIPLGQPGARPIECFFKYEPPTVPKAMIPFWGSDPLIPLS